MSPLRDQADVLEQVATLTAENRQLRSELHALKALGQDGIANSLVNERAGLEKEINVITAQLTAIQAEVSGLKTKLSEAQALNANFDKRLAAELCKHGIRSTAPQGEASHSSGKTFSEQLAAARAAQTK